jgi:hypothetical protein
MYSKGRVRTIPLDQSLIVQIVCSALLTYSLATVVLYIKDGKSSFTFSNSPPIRMVRTVDLACAYTWMTCVKCFLRLLALWVVTYSTVMNLICLKTLNRNAVPSRKNKSAPNVTILFCSTLFFGTDTYSLTTGVGVFCTVFPHRLGRSGPKMVHASHPGLLGNS